ncbi:MAG: nucleoside 2-deoxyribosyltransferase [bacterium]
MFQDKIKIYLAGSIDGLTYEQATDWRIHFTKTLKKRFADKIEILDPTKKYQDGTFSADDILDLKNFSQEEADDIFVKDIKMLSDTDLIIAYMQAQSANIGTIYEIGYAYAKKIPIIARIDNHIKHHCFVKNSTYMICEGMDDLLISSMEKIKEIGKNRFKGWVF